MINQTLNFVRCQRADGSFYGTSGKCRKGREVDAKQMKRTTKALKQLIDPDKKHNLGNGISVVKNTAEQQQRLYDSGGFPRPLAEVIGKDLTITARSNHRPWQNLELPKGAVAPYRKNNPMKMWMELPWRRDKADLDMAVNPTLVRADSLLKPAYDKYNKEFFNNKLPDVDLFIAPSMRSAYGLASSGVIVGSNHNMRITLSWPHLKNATEQAMHGILLHEMVHIDMYRRGKLDAGHGPFFSNKLNIIDKRWRRDSQGIYPDKISKNIGDISRKDQISAMYGSDFPSIKNTPDLRSKSTADKAFRIIG